MESLTNAATTVGNATINAAVAAKNTIMGSPDGTEPVSGEAGQTETGKEASSTDPTAASTEPDTKGPTTTDVGAAAPDSGAKPEQKQQGADRPSEEPGKEGTEAIKDKKDDAEDAMKSGSTETGKDGSGEPGKDGTSEPGQGEAPKILGGDTGKGGQEEELGSTSKEPGTGTKYVKSSGLEADGGDFDATKPGAAREADRLLEEKGIKHEGPNTGPPQTPDGFKEKKPSIASRIKEKLHIGSKKDKDKDGDKSKSSDKAKASETPKATEADKPTEAAKPAEVTKPTTTDKTEEAATPAT